MLVTEQSTSRVGGEGRLTSALTASQAVYVSDLVSYTCDHAPFEVGRDEPLPAAEPADAPHAAGMVAPAQAPHDPTLIKFCGKCGSHLHEALGSNGARFECFACGAQYSRSELTRGRP